MREAWEIDVDYNLLRNRENRRSPWAETRKWRRRFVISALVNIALVFLLLATRAQ